MTACFIQAVTFNPFTLQDSVILLEQIRTLDKKRLRERMGRVDSAVMEKVDAAIAVSFGLTGSHLV